MLGKYGQGPFFHPGGKWGGAQFSGQVLRKPSVTVYLALAAALLLGLFSREREPLEKGEEPVVLPGKM